MSGTNRRCCEGQSPSPLCLNCAWDPILAPGEEVRDD